MTWQATPYTIFMIASALAGLYLSIFAWRLRQTPGVNVFILLSSAIVVLSVGKLGELIGNELTTKIFSIKLLMIGIGFSSFAWFMLGLQQSYRYQRTLKTLWVLGTTTVMLDLTLIWTNGLYHQLFWEQTFLKETGGYLVLGTVRGPLYIAHIGMTYTFVILGSILMLIKSYSSSSLHLKQRLALILAVFIPFSANILFIFQIVEHSLDFTPLGYAISCLLLAYGYFQLHMVDAIPLSMDSVMENLPDSVLIIDQQNRIRLLNEKARKLLHDTENNFTGEILTSILSDDSPYFSLGQSDFEQALLINDQDRTYEVRSTPVSDTKGNTTAKLFILQDVTQRLNAEEAHQDNLRFFRQFAEALPIPFYELDKSGNVIYGNSEMQNLFGFSPEEFEGKHIESLFLQIEPLKTSEQSRERNIEISEMIALNHEGLEIPVMNLVADMVDEKFISSRRGVILDITHRKRLEEAIQQSLIAAEQANEVKSQFLANMSHEIRTPMNGVIGFAQLLAGTTLSNDQQRYVDLILKSGRGLLQLINDILDLSRIEAGKMELEYAPFNVRQCIGDVASIFKQTAESKGIEFNLSISDDLPSALIGDINRISQILNNVIGNAVKFTASGKIELQVKIGSLDNNIIKGNRHLPLVFKVIDTGIGIPEKYLDDLFDPFAQADGSVTRKYGGSGLGLAITSDLIKLMDGKIHVESAIEEGSVFSILIPLTVDTPAANESSNILHPDLKNADVNPAPVLYSDSKLLLVEDNLVNREVAIGFLNKMGYKFEIAENGKIAVDIAGQSKYDLILMDVHMPEMDGIEATRQIRARGASSTTPIVGVTADVMAGQKEKCLEAGMTDHLAKPIVYESLREMVEKYLPVTTD